MKNTLPSEDHLGEVVFVELPEKGVSVSKGGSFGAVESVKATSDVNSPISGEIVEVNSKLPESPGLSIGSSVETPIMAPLEFVINFLYIVASLFVDMKINSSPFEDGWMIKVKPSNPSELESLLGPKEYTKFCEEEDAAH
ncbi:hypothetical protein TIFTF001_002924 [Ficus carica]|uniref:Lipoyl-binding domain-containing protein n=1 Tax=Ficus carica TaxID=3494 RepID=A0AA87ZXC9_FICCA|nr:hypothetical protein TIFTF001_002924 [Ficus carica]